MSGHDISSPPSVGGPAGQTGEPITDPEQALSCSPDTWAYDHLPFPLPKGHRYPRRKYRQVREALLADGTLTPARLRIAEPVDWETLEIVHTQSYLAALRRGRLTAQAERELGLPLSLELVDRARAAVSGTMGAARAALANCFAANLGGGNHHAYPERGTGYCILNDIAVAIRHLQVSHSVDRIAIIDLDVHQGNANAEIFARDPGVFTLSVHGARNWPYRKAESDRDLALPDGTGDADYLAAIEPELMRVFEHVRPDLVFYQAGVDPLACDRLGRLGLSVAGLRQRDRLVLGLCRDFHCPVAVTMGGGYGHPLEQTIEAHANTYRELEAVRRSG